jgi:hypothetical protein
MLCSKGLYNLALFRTKNANFLSNIIAKYFKIKTWVAGGGLRSHCGRGLHQADGEQADVAQVARCAAVPDMASVPGERQCCQMAYFQTNNPNFGKKIRGLQWKKLVYFTAIRYICWLFGIFPPPLVSITDIFYPVLQ